MRHDLTPSIVADLERRREEDIDRIRKMRPPQRSNDAGEWQACDGWEDLGLICWVVIIVVIASLTGMYGAGLRDAFWRWVL